MKSSKNTCQYEEEGQAQEINGSTLGLAIWQTSVKLANKGMIEYSNIGANLIS